MSTTASRTRTGTSHKDVAVSFLRLVASGNVREAFAKHVAQRFRHHNPFFPGDSVALMEAMEDASRQNPQTTFDIQRAIEEADLVAVHSHVRQKPGEGGAAVVHIFRFEGDRIAELWDVGQPVPTESPNANGMF